MSARFVEALLGDELAEYDFIVGVETPASTGSARSSDATSSRTADADSTPEVDDEAQLVKDLIQAVA